MRIAFVSLILCLSLGFAHSACATTSPIIGNPIPVKQSSVAESSHVFKAAPGYLYSLTVSIGTSAGNVMLFDATTAPSDGSVTPVACYDAPANTSMSTTYAYPFPFYTGIVAVFSTTGCFTKTASNAYFSAQVK